MDFIFELIQTLLGRRKLKARIKEYEGYWHVAVWSACSYERNRFRGWSWQLVTDPETGRCPRTEQDAIRTAWARIHNIEEQMKDNLALYGPKGWTHLKKEPPPLVPEAPKAPDQFVLVDSDELKATQQPIKNRSLH